MAIYGISAYQQANQSYNAGKVQRENGKPQAAGKSGQENSVWEKAVSKAEVKSYAPLDIKNSLIPRSTEYGNTIGEVKLSDQAKEYYDKLKAKFHNMEFIAVSKDMKSQAQQNAASYGNANKMVVLIDEEKLERMAEDESFRKKYEGIISMSQSKLAEAKNSLATSGANIRNFGISVDANGKETFFATVEQSLDAQKKRIEKKAAEKKEQRKIEKKKAEKQAEEERIQKSRDERKTEQHGKKEAPVEKKEAGEQLTFEADSMEELLSKVRSYSFDHASEHVLADEERLVGSHVDFKG
ncbi:MAG: hypothetical protein IJJ13_07410 [Lachnospiraceae bacterium]|nr:hypothetical protein [Lachnospiraceae bacterium]